MEVRCYGWGGKRYRQAHWHWRMQDAPERGCSREPAEMVRNLSCVLHLPRVTYICAAVLITHTVFCPLAFVAGVFS